MSAKHGTAYTMGFAAAVCLVCSIFVCFSAVALKERQETNKKLDEQKNVLKAAGLLGAEEDADANRIRDLFESIKPLVIETRTGKVLSDIEPASVDMRRAVANSEDSYDAPKNDAKVRRIPNQSVVYEVVSNGKVSMLVLPVRGKGLWSTLYGFLALEADTRTVAGIAFYDHGETPGLGGEIENPKWTAKWEGREVMNDDFEPMFKVLKGSAGPADEEPHKVDGLSGATLTCNGVTALVNFWVGDDGFGPFLENFRKGGI